MAALAFALACVFERSARADDAETTLHLDPEIEKSLHQKRHSFVLESVETALTAYQQDGLGYQSKAGPRATSPGSERLTVFQPQLLVIARQNENIVHRFWAPVDLITAASPNANDKERVPPDVMSNASRQNQAFSFDWTTTYEAPKQGLSVFGKSGVHAEENFRSWSTGAGGTFSFADDNATISANANQAYDWFDRYDILGHRHGRASRSTSNGNLGFTQIVSPTTVVHANYGLSLQFGELSNTWNSVPMDTLDRELELMPRRRIRHAFVARFAQYLPWDGALKGFYRLYVDNWGIAAHSAEVQLLQRLTPLLYVRGTYRYHTQTAADFFTTLGTRATMYRTADSDLGAFDAQTAGFKVTADLPSLPFRSAHIDAGYERYWRTDGLTVNVALWQAGARF